MSKKNNKQNTMNGYTDSMLKDGAKEFARFIYRDDKAWIKKFRKKFCSVETKKKDIRQRCFDMAMMTFEPAMLFFVKYTNGQNIKDPEISELLNGILNQVSSTYFIEELTKSLENGAEWEAIELLPIVIGQILQKADIENKALEEAEKKTGQSQGRYETDDLQEIVKLICKKKVKKLTKKADLSKKDAVRLITFLPTITIVKVNTPMRLNKFFGELYNIVSARPADESELDIDKIIDILVDDELKWMVVKYLILERQSVFSNLNDKQKKFYHQLTNWVLKFMNETNNETRRRILNGYLTTRRNAHNQGKDSARRICFTSVSDKDYPNVTREIAAMMLNHKNDKELLTTLLS